MKTILVVGGAGFIGSHTLLELARSGEYKLVVFDSLRNGHKEAVEIIRANTQADIRLIEGDLLNHDEVNHVLSLHKYDGVIQFAALIEAGLSVEFPTRFFQNNVSGTLNLLQAMQANNVRKLVFSSTAAVYGTPSTAQVTEDNELHPESPYGTSKYMVELMLQAMADKLSNDAEKIDAVVLRYFNAAGANPDMLIGQDYPKPTHLITVAIEAALGKRDKLTVFGNDYPTPDGTCIRDYIHVQDLAKAHLAALNYLETNTGIEFINVGRGEGSSNLDVIKVIEKIHGKFNYTFGPRRPGDPVAYYADNSKARKLLNWEPEFNIEDIVTHAYNWVKTHPNGYRG